MAFFFSFTLGVLLSPQLVVGNFSYDGNNDPSHWGDEYRGCAGKYQSPINIEEKDVTNTTFPLLQFSDIQTSHTAYMVNNGHTVMIQSFDPNVPTISGGPINGTYVFQQLHFHWGENDNLGSEDLINNHAFSMELHAVFWKKEYGSPDKAMEHDDGLTVLGYLYQAMDNPNPIFESIVTQIPDIAVVNNNVTIKDTGLLSKLVAPDFTSEQDYFTYKGSLTTPPCLEIVQWIDFVKPQYLSHDQLKAFRSIRSSDGSNLTHNFRPVQKLDGRIVYRNIPNMEVPSTTSAAANATMTSSTGTINTSTTSKETTTTPPVVTTNPPKKPEMTTASTDKQTNVETTSTTKQTDAATSSTTKQTDAATTSTTKQTDAVVASTTKQADAVATSTTKQTDAVTTATTKQADAVATSTIKTMEAEKDDHSGQHSMWNMSPFMLILGIIFLLPYQ